MPEADGPGVPVGAGGHGRGVGVGPPGVGAGVHRRVGDGVPEPGAPLLGPEGPGRAGVEVDTLGFDELGLDGRGLDGVGVALCEPGWAGVGVGVAVGAATGRVLSFDRSTTTGDPDSHGTGSVNCPSTMTSKWR